MVEPGSMRLSLHQINPTVGDLAGNEALIAAGLDAARAAGAQLALFPELAITGYPPEDLLLKEHFLRDAQSAVARLAERCHGLVAVVGFPERAEDVYNAAAVLADGRMVGVYRKLRLPNYGVFDEQRYFQFGRGGAVVDLGGLRVGLTICEDIWEPGPPATEEAAAGASLIVNLSASPYHAGKGVERERMVAQRARDAQAPMAFCNLVGGQDELIFDGHSFIVDHTGAVLARARPFTEEQLVCDLTLFQGAATRLRDPRHRARPAAAPEVVSVLATLEMPESTGGGASSPPATVTALPESLEAEIYGALILGLHDYAAKNGFEHVVMGLSGGVDSALVACLAVDALGADRVSVVVMPSPYSSSDTQADARELAHRLGVDQLELDIAPVMETYRATLAEAFAGRDEDLTEENLQARIRGNLLMALSNKFGWLVLTTGNKSEMSVGYSTLYGDSAGGFAVIKDCPKTLVYRLCEHRLQAAMRAGEAEPIPRSILDRPPSAELRPGQRDDDSLPPYEVLDLILEGHVERDLGRDQLVAQGLEAAVVDRVIRLVDLAEYKRRQAPPGIKITPRAFGRDRRMPITNRYRG
jgi:NAD+ synthase (glutamine-hydrolysing)